MECKVKPIEKKKSIISSQNKLFSRIAIESKVNLIEKKKRLYFSLNSPVIWDGDKAVAGPSLKVHLFLTPQKLCLFLCLCLCICLCLCLRVHLLPIADKLPTATTSFFTSLHCQHIPHLTPSSKRKKGENEKKWFQFLSLCRSGMS